MLKRTAKVTLITTTARHAHTRCIISSLINCPKLPLIPLYSSLLFLFYSTNYLVITKNNLNKNISKLRVKKKMLYLLPVPAAPTTCQTGTSLLFFFSLFDFFALNSWSRTTAPCTAASPPAAPAGT